MALHPKSLARDPRFAVVRPDKYSQFGEVAFVKAAFDQIGCTNRWCFEVGAADGRLYSNTLEFREHGWKSVLAECDQRLFDTLSNEFAADSVCVLGEITDIDHWLSATEIPTDPDLGVIDVDGDDYWLFQGMAQYRPRVMIVEYSPYKDAVDPAVRGAGQVGKEHTLLLGQRKGYTAIAETYVNLVFVANECLK